MLHLLCVEGHTHTMDAAGVCAPPGADRHGSGAAQQPHTTQAPPSHRTHTSNGSYSNALLLPRHYTHVCINHVPAYSCWELARDNDFLTQGEAHIVRETSVGQGKYSTIYTIRSAMSFEAISKVDHLRLEGPEGRGGSGSDTNAIQEEDEDAVSPCPLPSPPVLSPKFANNSNSNSNSNSNNQNEVQDKREHTYFDGKDATTVSRQQRATSPTADMEMMTTPPPSFTLCSAVHQSQSQGITTTQNQGKKSPQQQQQQQQQQLENTTAMKPPTGDGSPDPRTRTATSMSNSAMEQAAQAAVEAAVLATACGIGALALSSPLVATPQELQRLTSPTTTTTATATATTAPADTTNVSGGNKNGSYGEIGEIGSGSGATPRAHDSGAYDARVSTRAVNGNNLDGGQKHSYGNGISTDNNHGRDNTGFVVLPTDMVARVIPPGEDRPAERARGIVAGPAGDGSKVYTRMVVKELKTQSIKYKREIHVLKKLSIHRNIIDYIGAIFLEQPSGEDEEDDEVFDNSNDNGAVPIQGRRFSATNATSTTTELSRSQNTTYEGLGGVFIDKSAATLAQNLPQDGAYSYGGGGVAKGGVRSKSSNGTRMNSAGPAMITTKGKEIDNQDNVNNNNNNDNQQQQQQQKQPQQQQQNVAIDAQRAPGNTVYSKSNPTATNRIHSQAMKPSGTSMISNVNGNICLLFPYIENPDWKVVFPRMTNNQFKRYFSQLLEAVDFAHSHGIMHRDIKPHNILYDPRYEKLYLSDWGLAEYYFPMNSYPLKVCSRYYKPPELLLGCRQYHYAMDIWSCGCILAAWACGRHVMFTGGGDVGQLECILGVLGGVEFVKRWCEAVNVWPSSDVRLVLRRWRGWNGVPFHRLGVGRGASRWEWWERGKGCGLAIDGLPNIEMDNTTEIIYSYEDKLILDLILGMLDLDPYTRVTAREALDYAWFNYDNGEE